MKIVNRLLVALICTGCIGSANAGLITIEGQGSGYFDVPHSLEFTLVVEDAVSDTDPDTSAGFYAGAVTAFDFLILDSDFSPTGATGLAGDATVTRNYLNLGLDVIRLTTVIGEVGFAGPTGIFTNDSLSGALEAGVAGSFNEMFYASYTSPSFRGRGLADEFSFSPQAVPLPATGSMLLLGLALLVYPRHSNKANKGDRFIC